MSVRQTAQWSESIRVWFLHISINDRPFCRLHNDDLSLQALKRKHWLARPAGS